jgi:sodium/potassium-transporting ATPase subunit alpha
VHSTVEKIRKMGVKVVLVTGDYSVTAASIAASVGILSDEMMRHDTFTKFRERGNSTKDNKPLSSTTEITTTSIKPSRQHSILLNGQEIDRLTKAEWRQICTEYTEIILSRATPNHKLLCVKEFQSNGHSVLAVGDGINDVPALKQANLSVAMSSGSKIASDLSHVVLLDSVFGGVYSLLISGRQVLFNIKKSILISITSSICSQYLVVLLTNTIGIPQLYSNLQMVVVNTFVNIVASLSLFLDRAESNDLIDVNEKLFDRNLIAMGLLFLGPLTTFFAYLNYFLYFKFYKDLGPSDLVNKYFWAHQTTQDVKTVQSISFYTIVIVQMLGNLYAIRMRRLTIFETLPFTGAYRNWFMSISTVVCFLLAILLVSFPIPGFTVIIPYAFYPVPLVYVVVIILLNEIRKLVLFRSKLEFRFI